MKMIPEPAIIQLMPYASPTEANAYVREFAQHGYVVAVYTDLAELVQHIRTLPAKSDARIVVIIDGRQADRAMVVSALRTLRAHLGIIGLVNRNDDAMVIRLLQMGVDACSVAGVPDLLVAVVLRLLWRLDTQQYGVLADPEAETKPVHQASGSWLLIDQGWVVRSPSGDCIALTTGERAFLMTLLNAPLQKASHAMLIDAVNAAYNQTDGRVRSSLGVMVSRMRNKFRQAGAPLPLKSVHNWGYMFVADP